MMRIEEEWKELHSQLMVIRKAKQIWPSNFTPLFDVESRDRSVTELFSVRGSCSFIFLRTGLYYKQKFSESEASIKNRP
jgi:hypothetical protein